MVQKINGRWLFIHGVPAKQNNNRIKFTLKLSLLAILMGIFLLPETAYLSSIEPEKLIDLTNQERQTAGLSLLNANQLLTRAAILKGQAILQSNTFKHTINDKKFSSWIRDVGYDYSYVGENLAVDFSTSEGIMTAWKNSPLHRKNLLSPYYQEIGIAAVAGNFQGQETTIVVQIFGAPAGQIIAPENIKTEQPLSRVTPALNKNLSEFDFKSENLLAPAVTDQRSLSENNYKLSLPITSYRDNRLNTIVAQSDYQTAMNNLLMLFLALMVSYLITSLYAGYLLWSSRLNPSQNLELPALN